MDVTGGSGSDVSNFNLYGANNTTQPSTAANNADRLQGPVGSPTRMTGTGTWKRNTAYTIEVSYDHTTGTAPNQTTTTKKYFKTVPASYLNTASPAVITSTSMTLRTP